MKKIKLNTKSLILRKEEISNLSSSQMRQLNGGDEPLNTGPCTTGTCISDTCGSQAYTCMDPSGPNCPKPGKPPGDTPFTWSLFVCCGFTSGATSMP